MSVQGVKDMGCKIKEQDIHLQKWEQYVSWNEKSLLVSSSKDSQEPKPPRTQPNCLVLKT